MNNLKQKIEECRLCPLYQTRNNVVFGEGALDAPLMFIGEAPGAVEDETGRLFAGRSGQLMDNLLQTCGMSRTQHVYLTNIVRCRPPENRTPKKQEINACLPYLQRQIELIDPCIIVTLGATALKSILKDNSLKVSKLRGSLVEHEGRKIIPIYHPSALLRSPDLITDTREDFKFISKTYREQVNVEYSPLRF